MGLIKPKTGGLDTSDATATPDYVANPYTFYADGVKQTGNALIANYIAGTGDPSKQGYMLMLTTTYSEPRFLEKNSTIMVQCDTRKLGDATANDVIKGKTFTSTAGLKVTGRYEPPTAGFDLEALTGYDHVAVDIIEHANSTNFMDGLSLAHSLGQTPEKFVLFPVDNYGYGSGITHCVYQTNPIAGGLQGYVAGYSIADSSFKITDITGHITMTSTEIQTDITVGTLSPKKYVLITFANDPELLTVDLEYYDATLDKKSVYAVKYVEGDTWADACENGQNDLIYSENGNMYFAGDNGAQRILYSDLGLYLTDSSKIGNTRYATEEVFDM